MAPETAQAQQTSLNPDSYGEEFVQRKDGTYAWRNPVTGEVRPAQRQKEWDKFFALLEECGPAESGFFWKLCIKDPPLTYRGDLLSIALPAGHQHRQFHPKKSAWGSCGAFSA